MVYGFKKALKITNWLLVHPLFELRCMYLTKKGIETVSAIAHRSIGGVHVSLASY